MSSGGSGEGDEWGLHWGACHGESEGKRGEHVVFGGRKAHVEHGRLYARAAEK